MNQEILNSSELALSVPKDAKLVFVGGGLDAVLADIRAQAMAIPRDISTKKGRESIASVARKIASSKVALDEQGKSLVEGVKRQVALIDAERRRARDALDALKEEYRRPLTELEEREQNRIAGHESALAQIASAANFDEYMPTADKIRERIAFVDGAESRDWEEFSDRADGAIARTRLHLRKLLDERLKHDAQEAEAARLKAENERLDREARDRRIADEAAEKARREAEDKARRDAEEAERKARENQERVEREKRDAQERAERAEREKAEGAKRAEEEKARAVQAERDRAAAEKKAQEEAEAKREADKKYRNKIIADAASSLTEIDDFGGLDDELAVSIIRAIADGKIRHVKVQF